MAAIRTIKRVIRARPTVEGAGVHLQRVFGFQEVPELDPFLLLDDFHSDDPALYLPGFPWHPHRGIETITYVLQGKVAHGDSMGNRGTIGEGDVQWMTAGSGIIHQEMPAGDRDGVLWGFQLWANLPAREKMREPRYREVKAGAIPVVERDGGMRARLIAGTLDGVQGPVRDVITDPTYIDVTLPPGTPGTLPVSPGATVAAYVIRGSGCFDPRRDPYAFEAQGANYFDLERGAEIRPGTLVLYGDGDTLAITSGKDGLRFLLMAGKPLREPVAWYGPIVMNTQEELRIAFEEYRAGTFLRHTPAGDGGRTPGPGISRKK
ncbi:MAG: pirin family protein [Methanomicrobiales archaeon]|nr:pirin family protein [Methanomicrobiales archaeon]